jgi:CHAD domain-containing protein
MDDPRVVIHSLSRRNLGPAKPVKALASYVARDMHPQEAFRATLSDCLAHIAANAATLRPKDSNERRSVEGLHQLRVAFRRLEVALGAFGREFKQDWLEELRGRAKILSGRLAPARDLDVFTGKLLADRTEIGGDAMTALRARAENARDAAWDGVLACITSTDFELFTDDVAALAQSQIPLTRERRLGKTARRMLERQVKRVNKRGKIARSREEADLHRLRIALKKLRYTAEFFAPLYPRKDVKKYLKKLRGLQNQLGDLNDIANVRGVVGSLMRDDASEPAACFAAGAVTGWYGARTPRVIKQAVKRYRKFRRVAPFWH